MIDWSILLKPKVLGALLGGSAIIGLIVWGGLEIRAYGKAQYKAGKTACETAVEKKAKADKAALDAAISAGDDEAAETQTVYVEVTKEVAVQDATIVAENAALKSEINTLYERIDNAPSDDSFCAVQPIPADSLQIHDRIDDLLAGR